MNALWKLINKSKAKREIKNMVFLFLLFAFWGLLGFAVWQIVRLFALNSISWAICFVGYPAYFIGFLGGVLYLWRHPERKNK